MSFFACPHAPRSALRGAFWGLPQKLVPTQPSSASQWLRSNISQTRRHLVSHSRCTQPRRRMVEKSISSPIASSRRTFFSHKIVKRYEELPREYRDATGLPFRAKDLSTAEVRKEFGSTMDAAAANRLLRILHGRRVAGTLEDPAFSVHTSRYTSEQIETALDYLRRTVPVEEVLNAGMRAEDELEQLENDAQRETGRQKPAVAQNEGAAHSEGIDQTEAEKTDPIYGRSAFDAIRARNEAATKALEKEREAKLAAERLAEERSAQAGPVAKIEAGGREITNPKIIEYYNQATSDQAEPDQLRAWERIFPSATLVLLVLGSLAAVASVYDQPEERYRMLREISTSHATLGTLVALMVAVHAAWRVPPLWRVLNRSMILVTGKVRSSALFTAIFSHIATGHLLSNTIPLFIVGSALHDDIGRAKFLLMFLACGSLGFLGTLTTSTLTGALGTSTLGASGATLGVMAAYFWSHRDDRFRIFGMPDNGVHGIVLLALLVAFQIVGIGSRAIRHKIDIVSHITGMAAGVAGIEMINRVYRPKSSPERRKVIDVWGPPDGRVSLGGEAGDRRADPSVKNGR